MVESEIQDRQTEMSAFDLSVVVPALNEAENIRPMVKEIEETAIKAKIAVELIVVDDASDDDTLQTLVNLTMRHVKLRVLHHGHCGGQSAATAAGIEMARAPYVATLDADLQNNPADLIKLLDVVRRGDADMAQGDRSANRRDNVAKRISSWIGRKARWIILGDTIRDTGCSARVVRTDIARQFPLQFRGMHRFLPVYARMLGAKVVEIPVDHRSRCHGTTKYGMLNRGPSGLIDCLAVRWMRSRLRPVKYELARRDEG